MEIARNILACIGGFFVVTHGLAFSLWCISTLQHRQRSRR
jgi:hypothetical protein